ncbi:MAG: hypothetical protein ACJARS_000141, partial [bacterium]
MMVRVGVVGLALGALVLTACGRGLIPSVDTSTDGDTSVDGDSDTLPDRGTDDPGTDDPGTDDPGTDDPGTDDPGTDDPGTDACIPDCTGQVCGDNGCEGECGTCFAGSECSDAGDECVTSTSTCRTVQIADNLQAFAPNAFFTQDVGGTGELQAQFYSTDTGTFSLNTGLNANFETCEQCLLYFEDEGTTVFFQSAGAINIVDNPQDGDVAMTLAGVQLVESTFSDSTPPVSTPVPGGECLEIAGPVALEACAPIIVTSQWGLGEFDGLFLADLDPVYFRGDDIAQMVLDIYSGSTGAFDLGTGVNANYETCEQCVTAASFDETTEVVRSFFATG